MKNIFALVRKLREKDKSNGYAKKKVSNDSPGYETEPVSAK